MSSLEAIGELSIWVASLPGLRRRDELLQESEERTTSLKTLADGYDKLSNAVKHTIPRLETLERERLAESIKTAFPEFVECADRLSKMDVSGLINSRGDINTLDSERKGAIQRLLDAWSRKIESDFEPLLAMANALVNLNGPARELAGELDKVVTQSGAFKGKLIEDEPSKVAVEALYKERLRCLERIKTMQVTEAVKDFLSKAASTSGAPLKFITPEVLEWIKSNRLEGVFLVTTKRTGN